MMCTEYKKNTKNLIIDTNICVHTWRTFFMELTKVNCKHLMIYGAHIIIESNICILDVYMTYFMNRRNNLNA